MNIEINYMFCILAKKYKDVIWAEGLKNLINLENIKEDYHSSETGGFDKYLCENKCLPVWFENGYKLMGNKTILTQMMKKFLKSDKRFMFYPVLLLGKDLHINLLIVDKKNKIIEHFEPNGVGGKRSSEYLLSRELEKIFKPFGMKFIDSSYMDYDIHGISLMENLSRRSIADGEGGHCTTWCFWWLEMRLYNSHISRPEELRKKAFNKVIAEGIYFNDLIASYEGFLSEKVRKFFEALGFESDDYANKRITHNDLEKIYNNLIFELS